MKAAFTDGNRQIEIRNVPDTIPGEGEMLLKIEASGMCTSDLHAYRAPAGSGTGMPIGHEPCGVVEELRPNVDAQKTPVGMRAIQHHSRMRKLRSVFGGLDPALPEWLHRLWL